MEAAKVKPLGRGLASLLRVEETPDVQTEPGMRLTSVDKLVPGRYQPRQIMNEQALQSLVASIREKGILQPIVVRPIQHATAIYEIIAGERRWQAAQQAGCEEVPVVIKELSDQEALETALIENVQRDDLTVLEEAEGYQRLIEEFNYTQEALAPVIGKSRSHLANVLRLLSLPATIKAYIQSGQLSAGHGRALVGHPEAEALAIKVIKENLNVRQTEKLVQSPKKIIAAPLKDYDGDCQLLEETITRACGVGTQLSIKQNKYKLTLACTTMEELDKIIHKLCR